jgi:hypothetical protein
MTTYRKPYKDPHARLKTALAALLLLALTEKRKLLLAFVADHGVDGLLDYADTVLDQGWDAHFTEAASILSAAAVDSTIETLDASGIKYTEEFVSNLEKHNDQLAKFEAASLLGLNYDHTHDVALPTVAGWSIGQSALDQLETVVKNAESSDAIETAISDLSAFSQDRAQDMAHNAIVLVDGQAARTAASATGAHQKRSETVHDERVCVKCAQNERDGWIGVNDQFSGSETMDVPHHINCLPGDSLVTPCGEVLAASKRWYDGNLLVIRTTGGKQLSCTVNHPILSDHGLVPARFLDKGSRVVYSSISQWIPSGMNEDHQGVPVEFSKMTDSFRRSRGVFATEVPTSPSHFHGDGKGSEVSVVWTNRLLRYRGNTSCQKQIVKLLLKCATESSILSVDGMHHFCVAGVSSLLVASDLDPLSFKTINDGVSTDSKKLAEAIYRLALSVRFDNVSDVLISEFHGYVYNMETATNIYNSNGIINGNCRCSVEYEWLSVPVEEAA